MATRIYWGRVITGGLAAEFLVFALVFSVRAALGETAFLASIVVGSAVMPFLLALWVCRGRPHAMLNGALVGAVAALFYIVLFMTTAPAGQTQPLLYHVSHVVKVLGGLCGGLVASRRRAPQGSATSAA